MTFKLEKSGSKGGEGILPLNLKTFFNKNANFTKKKLSHPNCCNLLQILNKLVNDEKYRVNAKITELEKYATLLEAYVKLVEHMIDYLDTLADARKKEVSQIEIVEQAYDFLNIVKEFLGELKEFQIQFKK